MTHQDLLHLFAAVFLVCIAIISIIDIGWSMDIDRIIRLKWSLLWYTARYLGIISGTLMALDILIY